MKGGKYGKMSVLQKKGDHQVSDMRRSCLPESACGRQVESMGEEVSSEQENKGLGARAQGVTVQVYSVNF